MAAEPGGSSGTGRRKSCSRRIKRDKLNNCAVVRGAATTQPAHTQQIQSHLLVQHRVFTMTGQLPALRPLVHQQPSTGSLHAVRSHERSAAQQLQDGQDNPPWLSLERVEAEWAGLPPASEGHTWVGSELRDYTVEVWPNSFAVGSRRPGRVRVQHHQPALQLWLVQLQAARPLPGCLVSNTDLPDPGDKTQRAVCTCCWCFTRFTHDN